MPDTTISPNMQMPVPNVGEAPGPDWATDLDACLSIVDSHNHTSGQGVPITPDAININSDLSLNGNNATDARSVRFSSQSAALSDPADLGCIYEVSGELFYNDASGNQVQLTLNGSPAGASGTITGLPSGTASASFSGTTFTFQSATSTPASMNLGPVKIAQPVASGFGVTISPSVSQASNYAVTLPLSLPSVNSTLNSDSSGNLSFVPAQSNVRSPEGAGTTTLSNSDNNWQIFNLTAARTVLLPSTGIVAGQVIRIENVGSGTLTLQSSNTNQVAIVDSLYTTVQCIALQASPTTSAHWKIDFAYNDVDYLNGTAYAGGNTPDVSLVSGGGSLNSANGSTYIPYQTLSGDWRLKFNILTSVTVTARTTVVFALSGITISGNQAIAFSPGTTSGSISHQIALDSSDQFSVSSSSVTTGLYTLCGDIRLASKPDWAY